MFTSRVGKVAHCGNVGLQNLCSSPDVIGVNK
jgi:hypothetical protein